MSLKILMVPVISYCDIPEEITENNIILSEVSCDVYVKINIISKKDQLKYDSNFDLENWIIETYPEVEGKEVLIHVDY